MPARHRLLPLLCFCLLASTAPAETVRFDRDIRPILSDKCFFCHGPDAEHREADLRLDLESEARAAIQSKDANSTELIRRIKSDDADELMPPPDAHKELSADEIELMVKWVEQGAKWSKHWSYTTPKKTPPESDSGDGVIDQFVAAKLAEQGKQLSGKASREKLIRRVTFDLTGMPPTIAEVDAFLSDQSADAYEKLVDRLLDSPRYGQRMGLAWLDAARYGDTSVYHADGPRDMWAWRDAIVDAYNQNMPFDEFTVCQLAGDLLPDATVTQKLLSGFNRNNGTTDEGGAIAEEYRVEYAVDRVKTTSMVWLGLTMECAQCHDHKYDPISQEEYYRFFAFFNVSGDGGMQTRKGNAEPSLPIMDPAKQAKLPSVEKSLADAKATLKKIKADSEESFQAWLASTEHEDSNPIPEGCLVSLPLLKGAGDQVVDTIDAERKPKLVGNPEWVKTRNDVGLKLNGKSYIDLGQICDFERDQSFSYGGWFKPAKGAGHGGLIAKMDSSNQHRGYDLYAGHTQVSVHIIHSWPNNAIKVTTKKKLKPDVWQHVFATYDGSSKAEGIKIYVDGELWDWSIEQDGLTKSIHSKANLQIGSRSPGATVKGVVDEVQIFDRTLTQVEVKSLSGTLHLRELLNIDPSDRTEEQKKLLQNHYLATEDKDYQRASKQVDKLTADLARLKQPLTTVMIMNDMSKPRETFVLNRGAYDSPTTNKVEAGTMAALPPMAADAPRNRLGLARWLFQPDHPLTARVAVNRYWQMFLGTGLVATAEDFGAQGEFPSHPELLDWLAVDFRENGWDTKRFIKQLLMSRTYQQTSRATSDAYRSDPQNRLLSRGPRFRLQGEFIRDSALSVSGLLNDEFGGPGVKPYQPAGLWAEVGLGGNPKFTQDHGDKLYRRSLYTYWKRSAPPPAMQIFDAPTREKCTIQRARTNTPLQALVTLNDTQFMEASRHFAQRMLEQASSNDESRIDFGFRLVTSRVPSDTERQVLMGVLASSRDKYASDPDTAQELLAIGEAKQQTDADPVQLAAWTILASTLLNLDETLTRE
ncbi:MAG: DUF1553 domain-containing protein [Rubripirellula sp.]